MRATTDRPPLGIMLCVALLALSAAAQDPPAAAADPPAAPDEKPLPRRTDIKLRNVRWQALPADVQAAFVGPDRRVWYMVDRPAHGADSVPTIKRVIEREFDQPSPQVSGCRPVLFERGGRVWFSTGPVGLLLGYDGKTWTFHDPNALAAVKRNARRRFVAGSPPDHGRWYGVASNLQAGDTLFFAGTDGVTTYDTKADEWDHQAMSPKSDDPYRATPLVLFPAADGKGAIAYVAGTEPALWQWRDGKWAKGPVPATGAPVDPWPEAAQKRVAAVGNPRFNWLHAVAADGTLFVSPAAPTQGLSGRPLMAFRPDAPDDRLTLKATHTPVNSDTFCVASDGSIWATQAEVGLVRFDGKAWQPVAADLTGGAGGAPPEPPTLRRPIRWYTTLLPGANREVLVRSNEGASLVLGDRAVSAKTLEALIEANRDRIAAAFPATWARPTPARTLRLFADPANNVWLIDGIHWKVLTRAGWVEGTAALKAAGSTGTRNEVVEPLGDGTRVYLSDHSPDNMAGGLIAEVRDAKVVITRAEGALQLGYFHRPVRAAAADGALYKSGQPMQRVTPDGKIENLDGAGVPKLFDAAGNLWATQDGSTAPSEVTLRRGGGKIVQTLPVPSLSADTTFFSGPPNSAYALNAAGLHRYVLKDGAYAFAGTYAVEDLPQLGNDPQVSPLGFLVTTSTRTEPEGPRYRLSIVELPK